MPDDFSKALRAAQEMPELPEELARMVPDLLAGDSGQQNLMRRIGLDEPGKVPGGKEFNFEFQCARLVIGYRIADYQNGFPIMEDHDDSDRLKEIMDKSLKGEAVIHKRESTFLKDGSVIVWLEWMEMKAVPPKENRDYLTMSELLDPTPTKPAPEDADKDDEESSSADTDAD
jgi:hypothetical protein